MINQTVEFIMYYAKWVFISKTLNLEIIIGTGRM